MRVFLGVWLLGSVAWAGAPAPKPLKFLRSIPHSGYSEGLDFHEGYLWSALPKEIQKINPADGNVVSRYTPGSEYSESICWFAGVLWNLSFSDNGIYKGKPSGAASSLKKVGQTPEVHGWGITHDGKNIVVTGDYSSKLYFLDPKTVRLVRTLATDQKDLEDLAWDGKHFWTSSFTSHRGSIFRIDPQTGKTAGIYTLPDPESCPVIDGIAVENQGLWVTGKQCPALYYFVLPPLK